MQAIEIDTSSNQNKLYVKEVDDLQPSSDEILVKTKASAINRADLLQRKGNYPVPKNASNILGLEMAGEIVETGTNVRNWKKGDRVFGLINGGGYAEYCLIHNDMAMAIPKHLSFTEAAAIPETFLTAFQALHWLGKLQEDETVLIHAAGSGVGTATIQLANQLFSAQIVATAGHPYKLEKAIKLGAANTYNYKKQNFADKIEDDLGQNAIDLIIDFIGAPYWQKNMKVLSIDGRLVYLAFLGGPQLEQMSLAPILQKRLSVMGSTLRSRSLDYKIELSRDFADHTLPLFANKKISPVIDSTFDWTQVEEAHRRMQDDKNTGKIVLTGM